MTDLKYLSGYPPALQQQVRELFEQNRVAALLRQKYPHLHSVRTDGALREYVLGLKDEFMRRSEPLNKIAFDGTLHVVGNALGTHTSVSRVQGSKLKAKREIRVASLFKQVPEAFLRMIVVHELAHMKERQHDKAFYQLCTHMEGAYHQLEFDLRVYLTWREGGGAALWGTS